MRTRLSLPLAFVLGLAGGCGSSPPTAAESPAPAPAPVGPCRAETGPLPIIGPQFKPDGAVTITVQPAVPIVDAQVRNVVRTRGIGGSTSTPVFEVGQPDGAPPPACTYTVVTPTQACLLAPTGTVRAKRRGSHQYGGDFTVWYEWSYEYDLRGTSCVEAMVEHRDLSAVVAGAHPGLRFVPFGFDVSYSGSAGGGPDTQSDGTDLKPLIAVWPADEQARYRRGPGFAAFPSTSPDGATKTRELTWFSSPTTPSEFWSHRLRDRSGKVLLETTTGSRTVLRDGDTLYWPHGRIR